MAWQTAAATKLSGGETLEPRQLLAYQLLSAPLGNTILADGKLVHEERAVSDTDALTVADFTGDGIPDVLSTGLQAWWLKVNDGSQLFHLPWGPRISTAQYLGQGDFSGDGLLDVLSWDAQTGALYVSENSDSGFTTKRWGTLSPHVVWADFLTFDVDGDGQLDVLAREEAGNNYWLAKNYGDRFTNIHWGRLADRAWRDIHFGDFDGDDQIDIGARDAQENLYIYRGTDFGFGGPEYWGHLRGSRRDWQAIAVGDVTGDGRDDFVGVTDDNRFWVARSVPVTETSLDRFGLSVWSQAVDVSGNWEHLRVLDVDGDAHLDAVAIAGNTTQHWVQALNRQGRFDAHVQDTSTSRDTPFLGYAQGFVRDMGQDISHLLDRRLASSPSSEIPAARDPDSGLGRLAEGALLSESSRVNRGRYRAVASGLRDQVAQPTHLRDLVTLQHAGGAWLRNGERLAESPTDFQPLIAADFTGSGAAEILGIVGRQLVLLLDLNSQPLARVWGGLLPEAAVPVGEVDLNHDGRLDFLFFDEEDGGYWLAENQQTHFAIRRWGLLRTHVAWSDFLIHDMDGDGRTDVLARETTDGNWWLAKNEGGRLLNHHWGRLPLTDWQFVAAGDFDGDGAGDIASLAADHSWWVWEGTHLGVGGSTLWGDWSHREHWSSVLVGDFNADGRDDVVASSRDDQLAIGVAGENGFETQIWNHTWPSTHGAATVLTLDYGDDGLPDLVALDARGHAWLAHNNGAAMTTVPLQIGTPGAESFLAFAGDPRPQDGELPGHELPPPRDIWVSRSETNRIVLHAEGANLLGIELKSGDGGLVPLGDDPWPFSFFLARTRHHMALATVDGVVEVDGALELPVGWSPDVTSLDLEILVGTADAQSVPVAGFL